MGQKQFRKISIKEAIEKYGGNIKLKKIKSLPDGTGTHLLDAVSIPDGDGEFIITLDVIQQEKIGLQVPIAEPGEYSGALLVYQELTKYDVPEGGSFYLQEISWFTNKPDKTEFQLTIIGTVVFTDEKFQSAYTLPIPGLEGKGIRIAAGSQVLLEVQSTDGTAIIASGTISGLLVR